MEEALRLHEFFIEGGNPEKSQVILHITEPSTREEQTKGIFFVLCETEGGTADYTEELETVIEQAKKIYYESDANPEQALEQALDKINKQSAQILKPYIKFHSAIGVLISTTILFAFYGRPYITLYYKNRENRYLELDLVAQNAAELAENSATESASTPTVFTQIIQGKITPGDYIFIGSQGSLSVTKGDQLRQLITSRTPKESAILIERGLRGLPSDTSYGGLIVSLQKPNAAAFVTTTKYRQPNGSVASLQKFFSTEQKTNETLSASLGRHLGNKLQSKLDTLHTHQAQKSLTPEMREENNYVPPRARARQEYRHDQKSISRSMGRGMLITMSFLGRVLLRAATFLSNFFIGIIRLVGNTVVVITNFRNRRSLILDSWNRTWRGYKEHFFQLPLLTKSLFAVSLILIIVFAVSIVHIRTNQERATEQKNFEEHVRLITSKLENADGALVYSNLATALTEITDAKNMIAALNCKIPDRSGQCTALTERSASLLLKARNSTTIEPQRITSFASNTLSLPGMVKINTLLLAYSPVTSTIFTYNLLTKEAGSIITTSSGFIAATVPKENDYVLLLTTNGQLLTFDPKDKSLKTQLLSLPSSSTEHAVKSLVVYNRRLYSLDSITGQLFRHDVIRGGFGLGREWIKGSTNETRGANDVAIDGDIFILTPQGIVHKFTNGLPQDFSIQGLDPALTTASQLWTYNDLTYIYILDTQGKRLIITDKNGKLVRQLVSPLFEQPTDMVIDEGTKTAYLIDSDTIFQIDLNLAQ